MLKLTDSSLKSLKAQSIKKYLLEDEIAIPIINFDDYYITSSGRVFSSKIVISYTTLEKIEYCHIAWKELRPFYCHQYKSISLSQKGGKKNFYLHKLVYEAFYGKYDTSWWRIGFKDGNVENCDKDNLKLVFRYSKSNKRKIREYEKQQRILQILE